MKHLINSIVVAGMLLASCTNSKPEVKATAAKETTTDADELSLTPDQAANAQIALGNAEIRTIHSDLRVSGMLEAPPEHAFSISVPVGGYVKTTSLIPGAHVHKGEVLLTLEGPQYIDLQQQYLTAKAPVFTNM